MSGQRRRFRMGRLDHVHVYVPDRDQAAQWYFERLGFEPVEDFDFWASGVDSGPLQISADGGHTSLALFASGAAHPTMPQQAGIAFSVDADAFIAFARSLPNGIESSSGTPLRLDDVIDFDLCWAFNFVDPWDNHFELNCYDYDRVRVELIEAKAVTPVRYWTRTQYLDYHA